MPCFKSPVLLTLALLSALGPHLASPALAAEDPGARIPASTLTKPPSAELRPDQKDTDSLPPYDLLDPIIEAYVERDLSPGALVQMGFDEALVARVTYLIDANEYKRRQAAPGIKITTKAFGMGRRFPIAARFGSSHGGRILIST